MIRLEFQKATEVNRADNDAGGKAEENQEGVAAEAVCGCRRHLGFVAARLHD